MELFKSKWEARLDMRHNRKAIFPAALVYLVFLVLFSLLIAHFSGANTFARNLTALMEKARLNGLSTQEELARLLNENLEFLFPTISTSAAVMTVVLSLLYALVNAGFSGFCLLASRRQKTSLRDLFISLEHPFKMLLLLILQYVLIWLLSLCFVLPGIIAACRWSQAVFIHYDHPDYSPWRCLRESAKIMKGRKMPFITVVLGFFFLFLLDQFVSAFFYVPILRLYLSPLFGLTMAHFYNHLLPEGSFEEGPPYPAEA
ncbi:MAG: DUF975 family protein [Oscillospiraceae bacterium]|nr:DUF975 family protein [Oscillospiraceae bacterium]